MDKLKEAWEKIKSGWEKLDKKKKSILVVMLIGIILFGIIYAYTTKKGNYTVLFSDLSLEDAGRIVNDLETKDIKYRLEDDGTKILIDTKKVDKYRLDLATEGNLPKSSLGMEIFDDMGMMVTEEDRKIMYQRGLEGELQRSIMSLEAVKAAKVHLVMSEKSIFETEEKDASASVILDIEPGYEIKESSVNGIRALISGAVENLPEENIQIIDSKGNILSSPSLMGDGNSTDVASKQRDIKRAFEKEMEFNLNNLLEEVFGVGKIKVAINADLDFDAEEKTTITYFDPVKRSEQFSASGNNIETQDGEGLIGNNSSNVISQVDGEGSTYEGTINNELSQETTNTIKAPGKINKLSASIIYDGRLSAERSQQIEDIVATAIGYDFEREDLISVVGVEFDKTGLAEAEKELAELEEAEAKKAKFDQYKRFGLYGLGGLAFLILLASILRSRRPKKKELVDYGDGEVSIEEAFKPYKDTDVKEDLSEEEIEISIDEKERKAKLYAEQHPELAADLIKAWLKDKE